MINAFLPRDKVYIPALGLYGTVLSVIITQVGIQYNIRYIQDESFREDFLYDFEVREPKTIDA